MATSTEEKFKFTLDIHFAQKLAGNVTKIRERTVKKLKRWIAARSAKDGGTNMEAEMLRLWKGLFYCMWMCDKPVVQEELADKIADLIHSFATPKGAFAYFDAFLLTMKREWIGIDRLRMDKYFMFIRRCYCQAVVFLRNRNWEESLVDQFLAVLCKTPLSTDPEASPDGLRYHFVDVYRDELARCSEQLPIPNDLLMKLLDPFCVLVTSTRNHTLVKVILRGIFQDIVDESEVGFAEDSEEDEGIDSGEEDGEKMEENKEKSKEEKDKKKNVKKKFPKLKYDYEAIADRLFALASQPTTPGGVRRKVYAMVKKFRDLKEGIFPDYNVESLMEYQDDDDEKELTFGNRMPRVKKKKITRRGGEKARKKRLAIAAKTEEEVHVRKRFDDRSSDEDDLDDSDDDEKVEKKKKTRRRRKKKRVNIGEETRSASKTNDLEERDGLTTEETSCDKENGSISLEDRATQKMEKATHENLNDSTVTENEDFEMEASSEIDFDKPDSAVKKMKIAKKRKLGDRAVTKVMGEKVKSWSTTQQVLEKDVQERKDGLSTKTKVSGDFITEKSSQEPDICEMNEDGSSSFKDTEDTTDGIQLKNLKVDKEQLQLGLDQDDDKSTSQDTMSTPSLAVATNRPTQLDSGKKRKKKEKSRQPFAVFQKVQTPPALVRRRAVRTDKEPQTEPRPGKKQLPSLLSEDTDSDQPTPRKRVKIALALNKAHGSKDYMKQLESSPAIPFDSRKKPVQSALKTPSPRVRSPKRTAATTSKKSSPKASQLAADKTGSPVLKKASAKSASRAGRTPSTWSVVRRSSRIKLPKQDQE